MAETGYKYESLKPLPGETWIFEFQFDSPKVGVNEKTGKPWYKYGIKARRPSETAWGEYVYFAPDEFHPIFQELKIGKHSQIEIRAAQRRGSSGKPFTYYEFDYKGQTYSTEFKRNDAAKDKPAPEKRAESQHETLDDPGTLER